MISKFEFRFASYFILFVVFILDAVFRIREYDDKSVDFQSLVKLMIPIISTIFILRLFSEFKFLSIIKLYFVHLIFFLFFFLTALYSVNFTYSIYLFFIYVFLFFFVAYVVNFIGYIHFLKLFTVSVFLFALVSFYLYLFSPELGRFVYWSDGVFVPSWRLSGLAGSANNFARIIAFALLILIFYKADLTSFLGRNLFILFVVIFLLSLFLSGSRTTIFFLFVSLILYFFLSFGYRFKLSILIIFISFLIILLIAGLGFLDFFSRDGGHDISTFTGRNFIWDVVFLLISESWFFGYGYGSSIFLLPSFNYYLGFSPSHAHNMYLQLMLHGGILLFFPFLFSLFSTLLNLFKFRDYKVISMFVFILLVGVFESGAFSLSPNIFTLMYFVFLVKSSGKIQS